MCGIAGFLTPRRLARPALEAAVAAMTESLRHRGPDDGGLWSDADAGIALGHRRLSIIDVSAAGHQPMVTADGRLVVTFNGEIYNYRDLAQQLRQAGVTLRSRSDTEVLLQGFAHWGVEETLRQCEGMFAFAVWDRERRELTLGRDRLGIKPLYWGHVDGALAFASELKALRALGSALDIDRAALAAYLRFGYVPAPASIYRDVYKLEPGTMLAIAAGGEPRINRYWDMRRVAGQSHEALRPGQDAEAVAGLEQVLARAVHSEMVSDVPLGAFLSGGIDSSLVTALMQQASDRPVKTFTIGFNSSEHNEAQHARLVATHLRTDHTELYVDDQSARDVIPYLPIWYDEPFADSSQIPTQIVSSLARKHVTVALSGDGGDELFGGYTRYRLARNLERVLRGIPYPLRRGVAARLENVPEGMIRRVAALLPPGLRPRLIEQRLPKLAALLRERDGDAAYRRLVSLWPEPGSMVIGMRAGVDGEPDGVASAGLPSLTERMMLRDIRNFLTGSALTLVIDLLFTFVFLALMLFYSPLLTGIVVASFPLYAVLSVTVTPVLRRRLREKFDRGSESQALLVESVTGMETVKAMAVEPQIQRRWEEQLAAYVAASFRVIALGTWASQGVQFISKLVTALILYFGALQVIEGRLSVGELVAFNMLATRVAQPVLRLAQIWQDFQQTRVSIDRLGDILNAPSESLYNAARASLPAIRGEITFEHVTFRYQPHAGEVLHDVDFRIPPGQVVGIVGPSGSGKSTLTKLIQRLYVPESGRVLVDGVDLALVDVAWLRRQVGVVLQESVLFNRSIRDNIALGDPGMPIERVVAAAKLAGAHEFILELPEAYDTVVGERGASLSGGQRQRIAIARALVGNPRILIFDEATSALDYESERIIQQNMREIVKGRTVLIIAHRLSTVRHADRILTLDRGRLVEDGSHDELIRTAGRYAALHRLQSGIQEVHEAG